MANDSLHLTPLDRQGITSLTSDSVTETSMIDADPTIYQGAQKSRSPSGDYRQQNVRTSTSGSDMRKEENNLLYAQTGSGTAIRHPTVRSLSSSRREMYSMDTLDELSSSSSKCHNRCLAVLLVITAIVAIAAVAVAVLAYIDEDDCTCDQCKCVLGWSLCCVTSAAVMVKVVSRRSSLVCVGVLIENSFGITINHFEVEEYFPVVVVL